MKRFSAPPILYPQSPHHPHTTEASGSCRGPPCLGASSHGQRPLPGGPQPQLHDSSSKRVKTEQTFESLFDKEAHSDVTIKVNADEGVFHAHRMVLEVKSDVLAKMLAKLDHTHTNGQLGGTQAAVPILHVEEDAECSQVFSRFLYFLYSGAVWLHQDYVLPLFRLAHKYGVQSLKHHCHTYIQQVLAKSCHSSSSDSHSHTQCNSSQKTAHNHVPCNAVLMSPTAASGPVEASGFSLDVVCDLYEDGTYEGDIRQMAFLSLCRHFRQLVRTERWLRFSVCSVCAFIDSDSCNVEENLILVSATDYMKRNNLADKKQIEDILSLIRYPRLNRRVLYHLQKNGSFKNFPQIQELMLNAMKYHSFKDLPEARNDFVGTQFRPRMSNSGSPNRRASVHAAGVTDSQSEGVVFVESAYSLEPSTSVTRTHPHQSKV